MQRKLLWLLLALLIGLTLGAWFMRSRAAKPEPAVAIQDGKTIDFSSGRPVVKNSPEEKAIIDSAVAEMDAAAKNVKFAPTKAPPPDAKR